MHTWHWRTWQGKPYLTCTLLEPWHHGFFTQQFWPRSPIELTKVLQPTAQVYQVKQVHGNQVVSPSELEATLGQIPDTDPVPPRAVADGLLTEHANQAVWVCSADCTPALVADRQTGQVAAIHAGWRGTAAKILPQAVARLQAQGSQVADLCVALGPAIAGEVYQVSIEVAAQVGTTVRLLESNLPCPGSLLEALYQLPNPPLLPDREPGHARLDIRQINALQLEQLGIKSEQIALAPHCTYQDPQNFFSYRRDSRKQVQWSGIVSREPGEK